MNKHLCVSIGDFQFGHFRVVESVAQTVLSVFASVFPYPTDKIICIALTPNPSCVTVSPPLQ